MNAQEFRAATRIVLVDDHAVVRDGFRSLLEKQPGMRVVGEAADGESAYRLCLEDVPDVVVIDLSMPGVSGIETVRRLRQRFPALGILVFSMHQDGAFVVQAVRAGANGFVTKTSPPEVLVQAVIEVRQGRRALSPDVAQALAVDHLSGRHPMLASLSPREFEILRALIEGRSKAEIAASLHVSEKTVANTHYQIKRKLGVATDIELTKLALQWRIVELRGESQA
jgi:DNA-binding NarL/FixJ family response regulator